MSEALRESNPRLIDRQSWWIQLAQWQQGNLSGPICTECGDPMPDAPFIGALVCEGCSPYVPEGERFMGAGAPSSAGSSGAPQE